jgi:DNA invertase Pin-like site-specific DNA recombinase
VTPRPVAYIRKSTKGGQDSKADQIAGAVELAARHGDDADLLILDGDWAISASREKTARRLDFARLMSMVEAGEVSALYATDADRLARSVQWASRLGDLCEDRGVLIHTPVKTFDLSDDSDRLLFQFAAITNEAEVKKLQRKAAARVTRQRERGSRIGQSPYGSKPGEDATLVKAAFEQAGSYHGAVRILTEAGVPSRRSHLQTTDGQPMGWSASTVKRILERAGVKLPTRRHPGSKTISIRRYTRLLICPHDGSYLTSQTVKRGEAGYICRQGHRAADGAHPRPYALREHVVTAWAKAQVQYVVEHVVTSDHDDAAMAEVGSLRERRDRLTIAWTRGAIGQVAYDVELSDIEASLERLSDAVESHGTWQQHVNWNAAPGEVNARLRDLLIGIELGYVEDEGPVRGRHSSITRSLVPVAGIWRRQPVIQLDDEWASEVPDPDATPVTGGWRLPTVAVSRDEVEQPSRKGRKVAPSAR